MGGGTFLWLKTGRGAPESAKQAEIGLAGLQTILSISPVAAGEWGAHGARLSLISR